MTIDFLEQNDRRWGEPDVAIDAELVRRVAAGEAAPEEIVAWIRDRIDAA
jgi:hypothetical protein